ncbi:MAG: DUF302 domain-containing protein [Prolixibacteraceae bacterium]|jgi:uncharacterized protein (DUF302 family)|nr:DUF302 domain-containing protein [Prolixibacteraceae bacterium]
MTYYLSAIVANKSFEEVEKLVVEKLKDEGFGIVTEMDMTATFKAKLDVDFKPYKILGACNPGFAYEALSKVDKVGVMLPCNVCIQQKENDDIEVFSINPLVAMEPINNPEVEVFAKQVYDRLNSVIQSLS